MSDRLVEKTILFVDDEERWTMIYVEELRACGYAVCLDTDVDSALKFFEGSHHHIALLILDLMMPYGSGANFTPEETQMGLRTGVSFYEKIRQQAPEIPVIILTNVLDETVEKRFRQEKHCRFFEKSETLPYELAEAVRDVIGEAHA